MDPLIRCSSISYMFFLLMLMFFLPVTVYGKGLFKVQRKFAGKDHPPITHLKQHDEHRHHHRFHATAGAIDLPLLGTGRPDGIGMYFTEIGIGTPPKYFTVVVDTGSTVLWVNCKGCQGCLLKDDTLQIDLTPYDLQSSSTGRIVGCEDSFCKAVMSSRDEARCKNGTCVFEESYGGYGVYSSGHYVTDLVSYNQVSGDHETQHAKANISFGCKLNEPTRRNMTEIVVAGFQGIMGFGFVNGGSSMFQQLASTGKVKKKFAHCLDTMNGGGIFAIGDVVWPKVKMTPMVPAWYRHSSVYMKAIQVGNEFLDLPTVFDLYNPTMLDSGAGLAYLPLAAHTLLLEKIFSGKHSDLKLSLHSGCNCQCFKYNGSVDDEFPVVTFHFKESLELPVYPHDYIFPQEGAWCLGWLTDEVRTENRTILGDIVLSNKLVVYDFEEETIGWVEHKCTESIKIKDDESGEVYKVASHKIPYRRMNPPPPPTCPSPSPSASRMEHS